MKKIFFIGLLMSLIFLTGCGQKEQDTKVSEISTKTVDLSKNIQPNTNIENIQIIPIVSPEKVDCEKYGGNETLKMADKNCSGLPNLGRENESGYVVGESTSEKISYDPKTVSKNAKTIDIDNQTGAGANKQVFGRDTTRNAFYHPDEVPVYGPGIHVNHTNAHMKMGYGPYETNTISLN